MTCTKKTIAAALACVLSQGFGRRVNYYTRRTAEHRLTNRDVVPPSISLQPPKQKKETEGPKTLLGRYKLFMEKNNDENQGNVSFGQACMKSPGHDMDNLAVNKSDCEL